MEKLKQTKQLRAMLHILATSQGVSEKLINRAVNKMSGRNVSIDLERKHRSASISPIVRKLAPGVSKSSVYQLKDLEQLASLLS